MHVTPEGDLVIRANDPSLGLVLGAARMVPEALPFLESLNAQRIANVVQHRAQGGEFTDSDREFLEFVDEISPTAFDVALTMTERKEPPEPPRASPDVLE